MDEKKKHRVTRFPSQNSNAHQRRGKETPFAKQAKTNNASIVDLATIIILRLIRVFVIETI